MAREVSLCFPRLRFGLVRQSECHWADAARLTKTQPQNCLIEDRARRLPHVFNGCYDRPFDGATLPFRPRRFCRHRRSTPELCFWNVIQSRLQDATIQGLWDGMSSRKKGERVADSRLKFVLSLHIWRVSSTQLPSPSS